jgi:hypothetical protein
MADWNRNVWYLAVVLAAFIALPTSLNALHAGAGMVPTAVAAVAGMEMCEEACNEFADCDTECFEPVFLMLQSTTCGDWDGGIGNLQCEGECGDDLCAEWAGESCSSCSLDCGPCPVEPTCEADGCEPGETCRNCPEDCACPDPDEEDDGVCGTTEFHETYDCQTPSEFCQDDQDCPDYGTIGAKCVENQCLAEDYDSWAVVCDPSDLDPGQCPNGWYCRYAEKFGEWICMDPLANR